MMTVTGAEVERFRRDGFLVIPQLIDERTVARIGAVYDAILDGRIDASETDHPLGMVTRQIMLPSRYDPVFRDNPALDAARGIARALLGIENPALTFDMLIYKEPGQTATTPWHQDYSYAQLPFTPAGTAIPVDEYVQFWVALDDVDEENGCMHFIPGAHRQPLLPHYVAGGDPHYSQRLLAIESPENVLELERAVACPLRAGGATVHNYGTPHFTSANRTSDRRRRAYIFNIASRPPAG